MVFRRRYLKVYEASGGDTPQLAIAECERRVWSVFNTYPKDSVSGVRKGLLLKKS